MGVKVKSKGYQNDVIEHVYNKIPAFTDVFTEETFYITVISVICCTIVLVFILSRFITLKPVE